MSASHYNVFVQFRSDVDFGEFHSFWPVFIDDDGELRVHFSVLYHTAFSSDELGKIIDAVYEKLSAKQIWNVCVRPAIIYDYEEIENNTSAGGSSGCEASYLMNY